METLQNTGIKLFVLCSASVNALQIVFRKNLYVGDFTDFQKGQIVCAPLAGASITKMATLLGASKGAVSKVMMTYTNHGRTLSAKRNSGQKPKQSERHHLTLKRIVSKNSQKYCSESDSRT